LSSTSLSFAAITQGTSSTAQNVTVTSSGGGPLHISSVVLGGANSGDFTLTNGCTASAYAVNSTCTIGVSFTPLAPGARAATVTLADDAINSPQVINLGGFANPALTLGAAPSGSTSATISAGQTAQFDLQITPGAGYIGTVSLAYSGAPAAATIQGPATLQISNGNAVPFTVAVATSGVTSGILPYTNIPRSTPFWVLRAAPGLAVGVILLLLLALGVKRHSNTPPRRLTFSSAFVATIALVVLGVILTAAGCGGGSTSLASPQPPQIVTPQGQFIIMVAPSATSANGKPLQLQSVQLTLTVN
jgi:hypothetical protein